MTFSLPTKPSPTQKSTPSGRGIMLMLLAPPGLGKTSTIAQFPNAHFIVDPGEQGIFDLSDYSETTHVNIPESRVKMVSSYDRLLGTLDELGSDPAIPTICLESLVGISAMCDAACLLKEYGNSASAFEAYQNGAESSASNYLRPLLLRMAAIQSRGKNVIMTGHSRVGKERNIEGPDWVSQVMDVHRPAMRFLDANFANIFHIGVSMSVDRDRKTDGKTRAQSSSTDLYTKNNPFFIAKNRLGLTDGQYPWPTHPREAYLLLCKLLKLDPATGRRI